MKAKVLSPVKRNPGSQYQQKPPMKTYKKNLYREMREPLAMGLASLCRVSNNAALARVEGQIYFLVSTTLSYLSICKHNCLPSAVAQ